MRGLKIGTALGIPVRLNWTFLIVLPLFAYLIGSQVGMIAEVMNGALGAGIDPAALAGGLTPWALGLAAGLGLFGGVLLHEFGHSVVAMRYGYEIESITLWLLGGLASFEEFPEDWKHEFWIAVAGPLVSVGVGVGCYAVFALAPAGANAVRFVFGYLALLNVVLAAFNMLPAFPMDGGRVLRALLARNQPHAQATQRAAAVGKAFAFIMGIVGLFTFQLLLIVLAFFVYMAASGEAQQTTLKAAFEDVTVDDVMTRRADLHTVAEDTSVAELMSRMFEERHTGYPVLHGEDLVGMVTLEDARSVREVERDAYRVDDVMATNVVAVGPEAGAVTALETMQEHGVGRLPVVDREEKLVGIISRSDLMTAFSIIQTGGTPSVISGRRRVGDDPDVF
ncbi:CBS domain-containing protein [Halorubrum yunnanense]|uniref:Zinc metalloprotease n=1 Tax=Halorubrum yunnanense TaxID=1526162 RepID=A0ABD5YF93_9EURY|nr:CBS domain-containing protein [Halorubrum yunnanense]